MNDLIHRIVGIIIEAGQSDTKKFRLGETIRYSPSEILEVLKQHENEIFGEESSTQANTSNTLNALNCIDKQEALNALTDYWHGIENRHKTLDGEMAVYCDCKNIIKNLPPAQPTQPNAPNTLDAISRQAAIDALDGTKVDEIDCTEYDIGYNDGIDFAVSKLSVLPPTQPERDIPMKPNETIDSSWGVRKKQAVCPKCDYYLGRVEFIGNPNGKKVTYCETCGQAINWEGWEWDE